MRDYDLHSLQIVKNFFTKDYELTSRNNIFIASLLIVTYVNYMTPPNPLYPPSNCVVHDDTHGWGG